MPDHAGLYVSSAWIQSQQSALRPLVSVTDRGIKVSLGLFSIADKVAHADESVQLVSNDVSATCGILSQLKDLLEPKKDAHEKDFVLFEKDGLKTLRDATTHCSGVFFGLKEELEKASKQLKQMSCRQPHDKKVELSMSEKAKWPFRQSRILTLRNELGSAKNNLLIILSIEKLALK